MKAIILISSIFYILGLKIGHKIDLTPNCASTKKVISAEPQSIKDKNTFELKLETDSVSLKANSPKDVTEQQNN